MNTLRLILLLTILLLMNSRAAISQPVLQNDYSYTLNIPSVRGMASSAAHLYVISQVDGVAVFRTHADSLQWLYTASGMQQRGHRIRADIRFAYLFGDSKRLTVLEPTSVLGAYSATRLPQKPLDVSRFRNQLYVALGAGGLGKLNLKTPETLDTQIKIIDPAPLKNKSVTSLAASTDKLYVLGNGSRIFVFNKKGSDITYQTSVNPGQPLDHLFYIKNSLMGSDKDGTIFEISDDGSLSELGAIGEPVTDIRAWKDWLIIRGGSNRLWSSYHFQEPQLWKENRDAGNYTALSKGQLWISEYDQVSRIREVDQSMRSDTTSSTISTSPQTELKLKPIADQSVPYPHDLLLPLRLEGNYPVQTVHFSLQTGVQNAKIRGQSLYWKPSSDATGEHTFKIIASAPGGQTSSTSFKVDVQRFNRPPRFTPMRTISIPVGRPFNLPVRAIDPDGTDKNLIRYLGVNLPEGASFDHQTGSFKWTPTEKQLGKNTFRVIATDQYGAASSANVTIKVINTDSVE